LLDVRKLLRKLTTVVTENTEEKTERKTIFEKIGTSLSPLCELCTTIVESFRGSRKFSNHHPDDLGPERIYRGDAGREKKSPAAHGRSIYRSTLKFRARVGGLYNRSPTRSGANEEKREWGWNRGDCRGVKRRF
jgi:hypothetical protein